MRLTRIAALALVAAALLPAVRAEGLATSELAALPLDTLLDMTVSGASKFDATIGETAAAVTLITREEIRALGYRTLADALATVKGISGSDDRIYSYIGVRAFFAPGDFNTRVLLLVDGHRMNDALYDMAYLGSEFPLDMSLVERIEFIPGQASAVYGANALFGVINVVTRQPAETGRAVAELTLASFAERKLRLGSSVALGGEGLLRWSLSRAASHGEPIAVDGMAVRRGDAYERTSFMLDARLGEFDISVVHSNRDKAAATLADVDTAVRMPRYDDTQQVINLTWSRSWAEGVDTLVRLHGGSYAFRGDYAFTFAPGILNHDGARARWWGAEARATITRLEHHKFTVGAEFQVSPTLWQTNVDLPPASYVYFDERHSARRWAVFAEDQFRLSEHWTVAAALRADATRGYDVQASHRLALMWRPSERFVLKAIHASAYRTPNAYEAYYGTEGGEGTSTYLRNPNLREEKVRGAELVAEWSPTASDSLSLSVYRNSASHLVVQQYVAAHAAYMYINQGVVKARGLELEWQHAWSQGARLRANLSHAHAHDFGTASPVATYAPACIANLVLSAPLGPGLQVGTALRAVSRRGPAPVYALASLTLSSPERRDGWNWQVNVANLFDRSYAHPGADAEVQPVIGQTGRSLWASLSREF